MIIRKTIDLNEKLTEEEKEMLREAAKRPPVYDKDNPPLTDEQLAQFYRGSEMNREKRRKQAE